MLFAVESLRTVCGTADLRTRDRVAEESAHITKIECGGAQREYAPRHLYRPEHVVAVCVSDRRETRPRDQAEDSPRLAMDEPGKSRVIECFVPCHASTLPQRVDEKPRLVEAGPSSPIDFLFQPIGHLRDHDWPVFHRAMLAEAEQPQIARLRCMVGRHQVRDGEEAIARAVDHE
jgi:hypothetical protein